MHASAEHSPTLRRTDPGGRGIKKIEYRSRATKIIGERFYIYASRKWGLTSRDREGAVFSSDALAPLPDGRGSSWPTGVIVGTAVISHVTNGGIGRSAYEWHLTDVQRIKHPRPRPPAPKPRGRPQPVWFRPF